MTKTYYAVVRDLSDDTRFAVFDSLDMATGYIKGIVSSAEPGEEFEQDDFSEGPRISHLWNEYEDIHLIKADLDKELKNGTHKINAILLKEWGHVPEVYLFATKDDAQKYWKHLHRELTHDGALGRPGFDYSDIDDDSEYFYAEDTEVTMFSCTINQTKQLDLVD